LPSDSRHSFRALGERWLPLALAVVCLGVYLATLCPIPGPGDSPELAAAVVTRGVPHPTGYPLYTLAGNLFVRSVPIADAAWRLNAFSALAGAIAVGLYAAFLRRFTGSNAAAWLVAGVFAFSPIFWSQCTVTEVYALHVLLQSVLLWLWWRFEETGDRRWLRGLAVCVGLSFAHHLMTVLLMPLLAVALLGRRRDWLRPAFAAELLVLTLAPLALYAHLPLAVARGAAVEWGTPDTLERFIHHVTGRQYHHLIANPDSEFVAHRLAYYPIGLMRQFAGAAPLALLGVACLRRSPRVLAATLAGFTCAAWFALSYDVIDPDPFYLPSCLLLGAWIAVGIARILDAVSVHAERLAPYARAACLAVPLVPLAVHYGAQDRSEWLAPHDQTMAVFAAAPPDAVFVIWGMEGSMPLYASLVERVRPDVTVIDLHLLMRGTYGPELDRLRWDPALDADAKLAATLAELPRLEGRPRELIALPIDAGTGWERYGFHVVDAGAAQRIVRERPELRVHEPGVASPIARFQPGVALLDVSVTAAPITQGDLLAIDYLWRLERTPEGPLHVASLFADAAGEAALDRSGAPQVAERHRLGQGTHLAGFSAGDVFRERVYALAPRDLAPGRWHLWIGLEDERGPVGLEGGARFARSAPFRVEPRTSELWRTPPVRQPATRNIATR